MSISATAQLRRAARLAAGHALRFGTAPARWLARAVIRMHPGLEPRMADWAWLWQPGWGRRCHERLYRRPDPYGIAESAYEQDKYDLIMQTLDDTHYSRTLEVGCGEGQLTELLTKLTDELVAVDISAAAIERTRGRLEGDPRVVAQRRTLPLDMPPGTFDLIICSDVLYYWEPTTLRLGLGRLLDRLRPGGRILFLHYRGNFGQANCADAVHELAREFANGRGFGHPVSRTVHGVGPGGLGLRLDLLARA
ncbi:class I SAM-dependent DNA methyltransferase [Pseudonocardia hispaniensis]|uniref:Class I SAM-dependent DNA methyltransferase n=1 Tax=Pseudonocardia hispaniensis TaxID=904933 RepID=A0ABW1IYG5_9PSEU